MATKTGRARGRGPLPGSNRPNKTAEPVQYALGDLVNVLTAQQNALGPTGGAGGINSPYGYMPMAMDPRDLNNFGPMNPMTPDPLDAPRPDSGRPDPRLFEYAVGWNLPGSSGQRLTSFATLRAAADLVNIIRQCIEVRKAHVSALKWSWTLSPDTVAEAYLASGGKQGKEDIEAELRAKHGPKIAELTEFWRKPWKAQGLDMPNWIRMVLEEVIVIDALTIHPSVSLGGDVLGFEVPDGTTIKPLLDVRGGRPQHPFPAYQQQMFGFPRGEFTATFGPDDIETIDGVEFANVKGGFTSDQLLYLPMNRRSFTPYGYSPVEQALQAAQLYLARQGWMLAEYKDGSTPLTWLVPQVATANGAVAPVQMNPKQRRAWEDALNQELGGQTRARHRMKVTPPGFTPMQMPGVDERYKPDYDLYLIKTVAGPMGVTSSQLGFAESQGLGNSGLHEGQAEVTEEVGTKPDVLMLQELINELSRTFLGCPRELVFTFSSPNGDDEVAADALADARLKRGSWVLNDDRKRMGLPTFDFPEADRPMVYGPAPVLLDTIEQQAEMAAQQGQMVAEAKAAGPAGGPPGAGPSKSEGGKTSAGPSKVESKPINKASSDGPVIPPEVSAELVTYRRWLKRNPDAKRPFAFSDEARPFLKAAGVEEDDDPKAPPAIAPADARWPGWSRDLLLMRTYTDAIKEAFGLALAKSDLRDIVSRFLKLFGLRRDEPTAVLRPGIAAWVRNETPLPDEVTETLTPTVRDLLTESAALGGRSAAAVVEHVRAGGDLSDPAVIVSVDWDDWKPGHPEAARRLLSADGRTVSLGQLLAENGVRVSGIVASRLDDIAAVLADGLEQGRSAEDIATALRGIQDDRVWAERVAVTEMARAIGRATLDVYRETGTPSKGWLSAADERVCPRCKRNVDAGWIDLDALFPTGQLYPPGHPRCRCALVPGIDLDDTSWLDDADAEFARLYPEGE